jgi:ParB family transcriptional regulator, chromosome partitioning protein
MDPRAQNAAAPDDNEIETDWGEKSFMTTAAEKVVPQNSAEGKASDKTAAHPAIKTKALGRGLDSLLPSGPRLATGASPTPGVVPDIQAAAARAAFGDAVVTIPLDHIDENPYQTRRHFDKEMLDDLADSIKVNGVVQPIVVRPSTAGRYVLVLGERRCRASKLAGKPTIPAIVRRVSEQQAAEMTIVENLQRQDLNCMEQATAFSQLSKEFGLTQEQIGQRVGMSRESVSNYMRLLRLPGSVMQYLLEGVLGFSEARALLRLENNDEIARVADEVLRKKISLAGLEEMIEEITIKQFEHPREKQPGTARWVDPNVRAAQSELQRILGVKVKIRDRKGKGKIVIEYSTVDDYERVVEMIRRK